VCEDDIEIENCDRMVDFTKCSYSILKQDTVHVLLKNSQQETILRQYHIAEDHSSTVEDTAFKNSPSKITILASKDIVVAGSYSKVFQFDESVLLLAQKDALVVNQVNLETVRKIEFAAPLNFRTVSIVNKTAKDSLYSKENLC